jgi:hypothetical protein
MDVSRDGKMARLPQAVRNELNRRLANGEGVKCFVACTLGTSCEPPVNNLWKQDSK